MAVTVARGGLITVIVLAVCVPLMQRWRGPQVPASEGAVLDEASP